MASLWRIYICSSTKMVTQFGSKLECQLKLMKFNELKNIEITVLCCKCAMAFECDKNERRIPKESCGTFFEMHSFHLVTAAAKMKYFYF